MGKLSAIGMLSLVSGLFMVVFKAIALLMDKELVFPNLTLSDVLSPERIDRIDAMADGFLYTMADSLISTPLYLGCIILGTLVLLIAGVLDK